MIAAHPGVADVAVVGVPDDECGEIVVRVRGAEGSGADRRRDAPALPAVADRLQGAAHRACSATTCRSRPSARCCARICATMRSRPTCATGAPSRRSGRGRGWITVCHTLVGLALGQAGLNRRTPLGTEHAGHRHQPARHRRRACSPPTRWRCRSAAAGRTACSRRLMLPLALTGAMLALRPPGRQTPRPAPPPAASVPASCCCCRTSAAARTSSWTS